MTFKYKKEPHRLQLSEDAAQLFYDWRNDLYSKKDGLPTLVRGYIPKVVGYALRLTGALHLMHQFEKGEKPKRILGVEDMKAGIEFAMFYAGQAVSALRLLQDDGEVKVREVSGRTQTLVRVLKNLKDQVDSGRLAVGFIQEVFNESASKMEQFETAKAMGAFLRSLGLAVEGKQRANGRIGVYCLIWNQATEDFIEDIEDIEKQCPTAESIVNTGFEDIEDFEDIPDEVLI
jgi:hypothetical protein